MMQLKLPKDHIFVISYEQIIKVLIFFLVITTFVFNDKKDFLHIVKILYIVIMGILMLLRKCQIRYYFFWAISFLLINLLSILFISNPSSAIYNFIWVLQVYLIFIVTIANIYSDNILKSLLFSFIFACLLLAIRLYIATPYSIWGSNRVGYSIGYNPNVIGMQFIIGALCCLYFINKTNKRYLKSIILPMFFFIYSIIIFFSGSRKSLIGLLFGVIIFLFFRNRREKISKKLLYLFFIVFIVFGSIYLIYNVDIFYNVIGFRFKKLINLLIFGDGENKRIDMITKGIKLFSKKPLFGYGLNAFASISGFGTYSHNNFIEMLVNFGFVGFVLFYSLHYSIIKKLFRILKYDNINTPFFISIICVILFLDIGVVSYRDLYLILPLASTYIYTSLESI